MHYIYFSFCFCIIYHFNYYFHKLIYCSISFYMSVCISASLSKWGGCHLKPITAQQSGTRWNSLADDLYLMTYVLCHRVPLQHNSREVLSMEPTYNGGKKFLDTLKILQILFVFQKVQLH